MTNWQLEQAIENLEQYKLLQQKFNELTREVKGEAWVFTGLLQTMIENQVQMANKVVAAAKFTENFMKETARADAFRDVYREVVEGKAE
jgi:hypothetical protein